MQINSRSNNLPGNFFFLYIGQWRADRKCVGCRDRGKGQANDARDWHHAVALTTGLSSLGEHIFNKV